MHGNLAQIVHVIKKISSEATILNAKFWSKTNMLQAKRLKY